VYQVLDELASAVPPGCEGVVAREDFQGNRSPFKNPAARGAITGLSLSHGPGHIFRALYEATACGTRQILDDLEAHGLGIERVIFGGGGVKSALWLQIHADLLQRPITLPREGESCALGSAMTAAVAAGLVPDLDAAAREMVATERVVEPDGGDAGAYEEVYAKYQGLYRRLND
jgi:ribulose kinase